MHNNNADCAHQLQLDVGNLVKNMAQVNRQIWEINKSTNKNMGSIKDLLGGLCDTLKTNLRGKGFLGFHIIGHKNEALNGHLVMVMYQ